MNANRAATNNSLPRFSTDNPEFWFSAAETVFQHDGTPATDRFFDTLHALPKQVTREVGHIFLTAIDASTYDGLRLAVLKRCRPTTSTLVPILPRPMELQPAPTGILRRRP